MIGDRENRRVRRVNAVDQCDLVERPVAVNAFVHGATFGGASLVPGLIFSIFGKGLGPADLVKARLGNDGRLTTELAGTRILIDGVPVPMIFSLANQISGIVPYSTVGETEGFGEGRWSTLEVEYRGARSDSIRIEVRESLPGIFTQDSSGHGLGAILNQDGSLNGPLNPAVPGSVIVLFATGEGITEPPGVDGAITAPPLPKPVQPVSVTIGGVEAKVLYAGAAPTLVHGVFQVNVRVPTTGFNPGVVGVGLRVGSYLANQRVDVFIGE